MAIEEQLVGILVDDLKIDPDRITPSAYLVADLGFDSLAYTVSLASIEVRFGIRLAEQATLNCATVGDLAALVERTLGESAGA